MMGPPLSSAARVLATKASTDASVAGGCQTEHAAWPGRGRATASGRVGPTWRRPFDDSCCCWWSTAPASWSTRPPTLELVQEYWKAICLKVLLKPLERTLMIQRQQSADHGIIVSPPSDTSEIAGMMQRAVHFPPPGNTASWAYDWGTCCAPTARSASAATRHRVDPQPPRPR